MNVPSQLEEAGDATRPSSSLAGNLPMELVLGIMDAAIAQHRRGEFHWSLSLSLVCRTVRASVLPIMYEVIFLDVKSNREGAFGGWDGEVYKHPELAFLSWLLHNPGAPPRQHIKHLVFRHDGDFSEEDLGWAGSLDGSKPAEWPVERMSARYLSDATCLYRAGLRPNRAFHVGSPSNNSDTMPSDLFSRMTLDVLPGTQYRTHSQLWAGKPDDVVQDGEKTTHIRQCCMTRSEIDPQAAGFILAGELVAGEQPTATILLTVQLVDGDYIQRFPEVLLAGLAAFLKEPGDARIVLACSHKYRIAGQTLADFVRTGAAAANFPQDAFKGRVRVSHFGWTPRLMEDDMFHALAHELRSGGDPWDAGYGLASGSE